MLQLRLRYLVGVGTLLSAAFVNPLRPFRGASRPPSVSPLRVAQALHCYDRGIDR
jgi:hypothetical protein